MYIHLTQSKQENSTYTWSITVPTESMDKNIYFVSAFLQHCFHIEKTQHIKILPGYGKNWIKANASRPSKHPIFLPTIRLAAENSNIVTKKAHRQQWRTRVVLLYLPSSVPFFFWHGYLFSCLPLKDMLTILLTIASWDNKSAKLHEDFFINATPQHWNEVCRSHLKGRIQSILTLTWLQKFF